MGITHVLRGEDHLANTPRQLLLLEALSLAAPRYGHLPLIVGEDGKPLSKRLGSLSLRALRERGYLPLAVLNHLARLGHAFDPDPGPADLAVLAEGFEIRRLGRAPARHDPRQLDRWQKAVLETLDAGRLLEWLEAYPTVRAALERIPPEQRAGFAEAVRGNLLLPEDAIPWALTLTAESIAYDGPAREVLREAGCDFLEQAAEALERTPPPASFRDWTARLAERTGRRGKALFQPLRAALTGLVVPGAPEGYWRQGPELGRLWTLLGTAELARRLAAARAACRPQGKSQGGN